MRLMGDRFLKILKILRGGVEVVGIFWDFLASSKKASADFSLSSVRLPCVFFANRGSGLRHAFFVSVILPVTCDGLDPLRSVVRRPVAVWPYRETTQQYGKPRRPWSGWLLGLDDVVGCCLSLFVASRVSHLSCGLCLPLHCTIMYLLLILEKVWY